MQLILTIDPNLLQRDIRWHPSVDFPTHIPAKAAQVQADLEGDTSRLVGRYKRAQLKWEATVEIFWVGNPSTKVHSRNFKFRIPNKIYHFFFM